MDLRGLKGAYLNNYALPSDDTFKQRASQVSYVVIKYGLAQYEQLAREIGVPWLAEIYPYTGSAQQDALKLAQQANQPGCVGAVVNMESGDGPQVANWDFDDGSSARAFVSTFRHLAPGKALYASIDTRGYRLLKPYQKLLADKCDGVFPMMFPKEFQQSVGVAANVVLANVKVAWGGKPVIVTMQGYDDIDPNQVREQVRTLDVASESVDGLNIYTIGHATDAEWDAFIAEPFRRNTVPDAPTPTLLEGLQKLRILWLETMSQLTLKGKPEEVASFITWWNTLGKEGK